MKTIHPYFLFIALCLGLIHSSAGLTSDTHEHKPDTTESSHNNSEHQDEAGPLNFSEKALQRFGVEVATVAGGKLQKSVTLPGEVRLNQEAIAHITPRYPAKITRVKASIGDRVEAGDVLALAESSDTLARFELKSLISGTVIDSHLALGEHLQPSDSAFVVANLSTLWADIALYPEQVAQVQSGQTVTLTSRYGLEPVQAQIDYVAPIVNERTRTGLARVFLDNKQQYWKPGQFIDARIILRKFPVERLIPRSAVIDWEGQKVVFVQEGDHWEMRTLTLGRSDDQSVEVLDGLASGERYIAQGGFVLKADRLKTNFADGHNH
ncbi:secretion protein HlyD [gamma proteobacterium HTCC5015]|nr:secretion protein HlyD [gamma proteobacterium HTCC5015]